MPTHLIRFKSHQDVAGLKNFNIPPIFLFELESSKEVFFNFKAETSFESCPSVSIDDTSLRNMER